MNLKKLSLVCRLLVLNNIFTDVYGVTKTYYI